MALAIRSGITFEHWMEGDETALETALELITEEAKELRRR